MRPQRKPPRYWQRLRNNHTREQLSSDIRPGDHNSAAVQGDWEAAPMTPIKQAQDIIIRAVNEDRPSQMKAIDEAIATLYPYNAKPGQREALHHLIYHRKDLILIVGTGFWKSIILQAVSVLLQKSITIVILPLDQIGNEQSDYIRQIGGIPSFLNKDTICPKLLNEVQHGCFTHVLISPELAIGDQFRPVASSPSFKQQVSLVVVDHHLAYFD